VRLDPSTLSDDSRPGLVPLKPECDRGGGGWEGERNLALYHVGNPNPGFGLAIVKGK
jgi:hypothetical protein